MSKKSQTTNIKDFKPGQKLPASWTKDVADVLNGQRRDYDLLSLGTFVGKFTAATPAYRCFWVSNTQSASIRPNVLELNCVDVEANGFKRIVTNGTKALKANVPGELQFIGSHQPVMLQTNETSFTPGDKCGPTTSGFVAKSSTGLIALVNVFTIGANKYSWFIAEGGGAGSLVRLFMTPSGGIPAGGSATCTEYSEDLTTSLGTTATVWNHRSSVVAGSVIVLVMSGATKLWVVEGNCPIDIVEPPDPDPEPPVEDP
jgi:hypothetical protein